jgi:hypothetical protein
VEPLKPQVKQSIQELRPDAAPEDIEEYERLLSERFLIDPDAQAPAPERTAVRVAPTSDAREQRLAELHEKLFGR